MTGDGFSRRVRLRIEQTAPVLGDVRANIDALSRAAADAAGDGVDIIVTPELSISGYDLRDRVHDVARPIDHPELLALSNAVDVVVGTVERGPDFIPYNTALHLRRGSILHAHRKVYLPTYGMFDEGRYFGRGSGVRAYDAGGGWRVGLLVCEDLWHPGLTYLHAAAGANLIIAHAAAGGRGAWAGGAAGRFASWDAWEHLACAAAIAYGVYVVVANRAGVEGSTVFCGGSLVVGPDGSVLARGRDDGCDRVTVDLDLEAVAAARRPFAHARDEDLHLMHRELGRVIGHPAPSSRASEASRGISVSTALNHNCMGSRGDAENAENGNYGVHSETAASPRDNDPYARVAHVIGAVAKQAMADRGADRIALIDPGTPEAELAAMILRAAVGDEALVRIDTAPAELEPLLRGAGHEARAIEEALRFAARMVAGAMVAYPINRTALLLSGAPPPDAFLPLADLFASQVAELGGGWSAPKDVERLATEAGGVERLDSALGALLDGRDPEGLESLPAGCADRVRQALDRGSAARRVGWTVPKLSYRTLGVDLFL